MAPPARLIRPAGPPRCIDRTEWWLCRLCGDPARRPRGDRGRGLPHLGGGSRRAGPGRRPLHRIRRVRAGGGGGPRPQARWARALRLPPGDAGQVPPGILLPIRPGNRAARGIRCRPRRVAGTTEKGELLHDVFRDFMSLAVRRRAAGTGSGRGPAGGGPRAKIDGGRGPSPRPTSTPSTRGRRAAPGGAHLPPEEEASAGTAGPSSSRRPSAWRRKAGRTPGLAGPRGDNPARRLTIRARGRIDRVDEVVLRRPAPSTSGTTRPVSDGAYNQDDPLQGGPVQHVIYLELAKARLDYLYPVARSWASATSSPPREHGDGSSGDGRTRGGPGPLALLRGMLATGCFPFTDVRETWA